MPYIKAEDRVRAAQAPANAGELNFAITKLCTGYLQRRGLKYAHLNDCVGALMGAMLEMYRRVAAPYEDVKVDQNGDVYPPEILP